ncbi:MAG: cold shock domain-containing protein [Burkholderiaceae bacterium]|nr:cold shock domain-containing protein [Burkholderiaceae bacterium]
MKQGTVKWFDDNKGYGFIVGDDEPDEIFVHYREVVMHGRKTLEKNQRVYYACERSERGLYATKVVPQGPQQN